MFDFHTKNIMTSTSSLAYTVTDEEQAQKRRKRCDDEERPENDHFNSNRNQNNSDITTYGRKHSHCSHESLDRLTHGDSEEHERSLESMDHDDGDYLINDYANVTDGEGDSGESPEGKVVPFATISSTTVSFSNGGDTMMMLSDNRASQDDRDSVHHRPIQEDPYPDVNTTRHHTSPSTSTASNDEDLRHRHTIIPLTTSHSHSPQDSHGDIDMTTSRYGSGSGSGSDQDMLSAVVPPHTTHDVDDTVDDTVDVDVDDVAVDDIDDADDDDNRSPTTTRPSQRAREMSLSSALSHRDLDCEVRRSCRIRRVQLPVAPPVLVTKGRFAVEAEEDKDVEAGKDEFFPFCDDHHHNRTTNTITTSITTTPPTTITASITDNNHKEKDENHEDGYRNRHSNNDNHNNDNDNSTSIGK